ncbi:DUF2442 domain-containing protein [Pseudomonas lijiangensis]|uniref:DUF2442 domain-containing protein n=1 Tax=Pseudomonas lijiangensis TaxID=2995658 RepID=UPI0031BB887E
MTTVKAEDRFDEIITEEIREKARFQGRTRGNGTLHASTLHYLAERQCLLVGFDDQSALALPIKNYPELASLPLEDLEHLKLGFAGSALCLEKHDLHISIAGMVAASLPLMDMAATLIASRNGSACSKAKARASRANGLKGGRPRKTPLKT